MTEKMLNTRVQLKYDSYANWTSTSLGADKGANFVLKAGEIGICYLPSGASENQVSGSQPPQILFKVGDGSSKFSALPWASAKAADVYEWAKKSESEFTTWVKGLIEVTDIDTYSKDEIDSKLAANSTADQKYAKDYTDSVAKECADAIAAIKNGNSLDSFADVEESIESIQEQLDNDVAKGITIAMDEAQKKVASVTAADTSITIAGTATAPTVAVKLDPDTKNAIKLNANGLMVDVSQLSNDVAELSDRFDEMDAYIGAIPDNYTEDNIVSYINKKAEETLSAAQGGSSETAASVKQQLDNYKSENDTRVKAAEDAIDAIEADYLKAADKTELANAIAAEKTRAEGIEGGLRTDVNAIKADYLKAADKTALQEQITTNANAIERLTNGVSADEIDGVNELIQYVKDHGAEVTGMQEDIKANADAIAAIPQADWSQNDPEAADYVKNRTHYEDIQAEYLLQDIPMSSMTSGSRGDGYIEYPDGVVPTLEEGKTYYLNFNGDVYSSAAVSNWQLVFQDIRHPDGSDRMIQISLVSDSIADRYGIETLYCYDYYYDWENSDITFSVYSGTIDIKQLDEKFIPDTIARTSAIDAIINGSTIDNFKDLVDRLDDFGNNELGNVSSLKTDASKVVSAINEVHDEVDAIKNHDTVDSFADVMAEVAKKQDIIPENTYDAHGAAAQALADAKAYADQAEADAISAANTNTANVIKNYYTKSEADAAFMDATETGNAIDAKITALNLDATYEPIGAETRAKSYADSLAGNYATAAQGTKADSALQAVEVGTGLKVSAKANNKQTIEIDDTVVFVFNCGDSQN